MKLRFLPVIWLGLSLTAGAQDKDKPAAAPEKPAQPQQQLAPNQQAFLNLPQETRTKFIELLKEANRLFQEKRVFETLDVLDKSDVIFKDSPETLNLRGSCYVEFRDFDKAMAAFKEAEKLTPNNPSVKFNIGEVYFVTKQWKDAQQTFEEVLKSLPPNSNNALSRLLEFKILLCKLKNGQKQEAVAMADKYDHMDDSPYYYYAHASLAYEQNNLLKAEEWLASAGRVFQNPAILSPWQDTLVEFGYIKSFYGEEAPDK